MHTPLVIYLKNELCLHEATVDYNSIAITKLSYEYTTLCGLWNIRTRNALHICRHKITCQYKNLYAQSFPCLVLRSSYDSHAKYNLYVC